MVQTTWKTDQDILELNLIGLTCFSHSRKNGGGFKQKSLDDNNESKDYHRKENQS